MPTHCRSCEFKECKSGMLATVCVNENIGVVSWSAGICTECAAATGLKDNDNISVDDAETINQKLLEYYGRKGVSI